MRYLTIALTKGRLAGETLKLFKKAGITSGGADDKDTRKLIFTNEGEMPHVHLRSRECP